MPRPSTRRSGDRETLRRSVTAAGSVKTEFAKYGEVVERVNKNLETARNQMERLGVRSRAVSKKLRHVESLSEPEAKLLLNLGTPLDEDEDIEEAWAEPPDNHLDVPP